MPPFTVIAPDGYYYNGKEIDIAAKIAEVAKKLPTVRKVLVVDYLGKAVSAVPVHVFRAREGAQGNVVHDADARWRLTGGRLSSHQGIAGG